MADFAVPMPLFYSGHVVERSLLSSNDPLISTTMNTFMGAPLTAHTQDVHKYCDEDHDFPVIPAQDSTNSASGTRTAKPWRLLPPSGCRWYFNRHESTI